MKIKFIGHSCFQIKEDNIILLTDPFISKNPLVKGNPKDYHPDLILVSHDHFDHVGDTIEIAKANSSTVICETSLANKLKSSDLKILSGTIGDTIPYKHLEISFVKAQHPSDSGVAIGLIIKTKDHVIYFAGDTGYFLEIKRGTKTYHPDIAILPIGGKYTIDPKGAIEFLKIINPKIVIPMHFGTFPGLPGTPEELERLINEEKLETKQITLNLGQEIEL